jgi:hypothetical protein
MKALWRLKYLKPDAADSSLPGYAAVYFDIDTNVLEDTAILLPQFSRQKK